MNTPQSHSRFLFVGGLYRALLEATRRYGSQQHGSFWKINQDLPPHEPLSLNQKRFNAESLLYFYEQWRTRHGKKIIDPTSDIPGLRILMGKHPTLINQQLQEQKEATRFWNVLGLENAPQMPDRFDMATYLVPPDAQWVSEVTQYTFAANDGVESRGLYFAEAFRPLDWNPLTPIGVLPTTDSRWAVIVAPMEQCATDRDLLHSAWYVERQLCSGIRPATVFVPEVRLVTANTRHIRGLAQLRLGASDGLYSIGQNSMCAQLGLSPTGPGADNTRRKHGPVFYGTPLVNIRGGALMILAYVHQPGNRYEVIVAAHMCPDVFVSQHDLEPSPVQLRHFSSPLIHFPPFPESMETATESGPTLLINLTDGATPDVVAAFTQFVNDAELPYTCGQNEVRAAAVQIGGDGTDNMLRRLSYWIRTLQKWWLKVNQPKNSRASLILHLHSAGGAEFSAADVTTIARQNIEHHRADLPSGIYYSQGIADKLYDHWRIVSIPVPGSESLLEADRLIR